jgi:hypothetical protein
VSFACCTARSIRDTLTLQCPWGSSCKSKPSVRLLFHHRRFTLWGLVSSIEREHGVSVEASRGTVWYCIKVQCVAHFDRCGVAEAMNHADTRRASRALVCSAFDSITSLFRRAQPGGALFPLFVVAIFDSFHGGRVGHQSFFCARMSNGGFGRRRVQKRDTQQVQMLVVLAGERSV